MRKLVGQLMFILLNHGRSLSKKRTAALKTVATVKTLEA